MKIETQREKEITAFIEASPGMEVKELKAPILLGGKQEYYPVWKIPTKLLIYNIRNGRFTAELLAKEKELGRSLDPTSPEDRKIIQKLLLDQNPTETSALKESLKEWGQLEEGIITWDGAVINANRRMAIIEKLFEETSGDNRFEFLKVARLPKSVSEKDLWRIEAGLQFAKDFKVEYGPVNELLKLREGIRRDLSAKQISKYLEGRYSPGEVEERLKVLELIDTYLDYIGRPKDYQLFQEERKVELFNSLRANVISSLENERIKGKNDLSKKDIAKVIEVALPLIESDKVSYLQVRKLKGIAKDKAALETLLKGYSKALAKPSTSEKPHSKEDLQKLVDSLEIAIESADAKKEHDKPKKVLERALVLVESVDKSSAKLKDAESRTLLQQISDTVQTLLKAAKAK